MCILKFAGSLKKKKTKLEIDFLFLIQSILIMVSLLNSSQIPSTSPSTQIHTLSFSIENKSATTYTGISPVANWAAVSRHRGRCVLAPP